MTIKINKILDSSCPEKSFRLSKLIIFSIFKSLSTNFRNQRWYPVSCSISLVKSDHYTSSNDHFKPNHVMNACSFGMNLTGYGMVRVTNVEVILIFD